MLLTLGGTFFSRRFADCGAGGNRGEPSFPGGLRIAGWAEIGRMLLTRGGTFFSRRFADCGAVALGQVKYPKF